MHRGRRILLLEDDTDDARRAREVLAEHGYMVTVAANLATAKRAIKRDPEFDLVIVDHHLPDGEGPTIIPPLRAAGSRAPVVLVTGNRSERVAEMAFEAGCIDTAVKDLNYHEWLPKLAEALIAAPSASGQAWGPHVMGICVGRVHGQAWQANPPELWAPYSLALQSATELAIRSVRATGQSLLGSLTMVHVQVRTDLHLVNVMRGGVFAAALTTKPPTDEDGQQLVEEAMMFARARTASDEADATGTSG